MLLSIVFMIIHSFFHINTSSYETIKLEKENWKIKTINKEQNRIHRNYRTKRSASSSISLENFMNHQYYGKVKIGSSGQVYNIMYDTGSDINWIPKKYSPQNTCAMWDKIYKSESFQDWNREIEISYLKGNVTVQLGSDSITIGNMTVENQTLGLAIKSDCEDEVYEGIIGLSFHSINKSSIIQNMLSQGLIKKPVFAFYLNRNPWSSDSELTIGGYNPKHMKTKQLNTIQITDPVYWQVPMDMVIFGKTTIAVNQKAIIDSGCSIIVAPIKFRQYLIDIIRKYYDIDIRQDKGFLAFTMNETIKLPSISFILGNHYYSLNAKDYIIGISDGIAIGILFDNFRQDTWVLGTSFLQKYYSVFNFGSKTISFPKTRSISTDQISKSINAHLASKSGSINIEIIQGIIYTLLGLFISHKLCYI